ncbi:MAG TPA: S53 family peptidase [Solirubrobacteraceae bacterium]|nr:S53 family peptidase [Solirubrobacteraceae bacterium]
MQTWPPSADIGLSDAGPARRTRRGVWPSVALACVIAALLVLAPASDAAAAQTTHVGSAAALPANSQLTGALPAGTEMHLDVALRSQDPAAMEQLATETATPGSPNFRHYLSVSEFASRFGATPTAIEQVSSALAAHGLDVGQPLANDLTIPVTGTAAQVEATFSLGLSQITLPTGRNAYLNQQAPSVSTGIAPYVQAVFGLNSVAIPETKPPSAPSSQSANALMSPLAPELPSPAQVVTGGPQPCSSVLEAQQAFESEDGSVGRTSDQLANDYQYSGLYKAGDLGQGVTVALPEIEKFNPSDIATFQACYGTSASVTSEPVSNGPSSSSEEGEAALDIENVVSLAPKASVVVFESGSKSNAIVEELFNAIITQNKANVISSSLAFCETFYTAAEREAENAVFNEADLQGESVLNASGDTGSAACKRLENKEKTQETEVVTMAQAAQPLVTGVGGTTSWDTSGTHHEAVWNGPYEESGVSAGASGGGVSALWAMPSYQSSASSSLHVINEYSNGEYPLNGERKGEHVEEAKPCGHADCREVPDVSADADSRTGYLVFFQGNWEIVGGTSGATPLWAALIALADSSSTCDGVPLGFLNPSLYSIAGSNYGANFHDVTEGAGELGGSTNSPYELFYEFYLGEHGPYPVGPGYDMATGLGTPDGETLASSLCSMGGGPAKHAAEEAAAKKRAEEEAAAKKRAEELKRAEEAKRAIEALNAQMLKLLGGQLAPSGKNARIARVLKLNGFTLTFKADEAGSLTIDWYQVPRGAKLAAHSKHKPKPKPVLIASGHVTFSAAGTKKVKLKLTKAGKKLLKHAANLPLTAQGTFVASNGAHLQAKKSFVLHKK